MPKKLLKISEYYEKNTSKKDGSKKKDNGKKGSKKEEGEKGKDDGKKGSKKEEGKKGKDDGKKGSKKDDGKKGKEGEKGSKKEEGGKDGSKKKGSKKKAVKVYCGPKKVVPKTYDRPGTMLECAEKRGGIALWGVNKVDSKILKMVNGENGENKKTEDLIKEVKLKQAGLQGKLTKLRKEYNSAKDDKIKENIKKEFEKIKNEINKLQETVDTLKKKL